MEMHLMHECVNHRKSNHSRESFVTNVVENGRYNENDYRFYQDLFWVISLNALFI